VRLSRIEWLPPANGCHKQQHHAIFKFACHDQRKSGGFCAAGGYVIRHFVERSGTARPVRDHCSLPIAGTVRAKVELRTLWPQWSSSFAESLCLRSQSASPRSIGDG